MQLRKDKFKSEFQLQGPKTSRGRFELPACGLGNRRSIQLSYRDLKLMVAGHPMRAESSNVASASKGAVIPQIRRPQMNSDIIH